MMKPADPTSKPAVWITPREAAEYLNVGVDIIYDGCAAGGLKHTRLGHRTIRLRREWLDAWAEAHTRVAK
jgi:excisionase family DNA binding protein